MPFSIRAQDAARRLRIGIVSTKDPGLRLRLAKELLHIAGTSYHHLFLLKYLPDSRLKGFVASGLLEKWPTPDNIVAIIHHAPNYREQAERRLIKVLGQAKALRAMIKAKTSSRDEYCRQLLRLPFVTNPDLRLIIEKTTLEDLRNQATRLLRKNPGRSDLKSLKDRHVLSDAEYDVGFWSKVADEKQVGWLLDAGPPSPFFVTGSMLMRENPENEDIPHFIRHITASISREPRLPPSEWDEDKLLFHQKVAYLRTVEIAAALLQKTTLSGTCYLIMTLEPQLIDAAWGKMKTLDMIPSLLIRVMRKFPSLAAEAESLLEKTLPQNNGS